MEPFFSKRCQIKAGLPKRKHRITVGCIVTIDNCDRISSSHEQTNMKSPLMSPGIRSNRHITMRIPKKSLSL